MSNPNTKTPTSESIEFMIENMSSYFYDTDVSYLRDYQESQLYELTEPGTFNKTNKGDIFVVSYNSCIPDTTYNASSTIKTGSGNDFVVLGRGNDVAKLGSGNDTVVIDSTNSNENTWREVYGGSGNDEYDIVKGLGTTVIHEDGGDDKLVFERKISAEDLSFEQDDDDLMITDTDGGSVIIVENYFADPFGGLGALLKAYGIDTSALSALGIENKNLIETIVIEGQAYDFDEYVQDHLV